MYGKIFYNSFWPFENWKDTDNDLIYRSAIQIKEHQKTQVHERWSKAPESYHLNVRFCSCNLLRVALHFFVSTKTETGWVNWVKALTCPTVPKSETLLANSIVMIHRLLLEADQLEKISHRWEIVCNLTSSTTPAWYQSISALRLRWIWVKAQLGPQHRSQSRNSKKSDCSFTRRWVQLPLWQPKENSKPNWATTAMVYRM